MTQCDRIIDYVKEFGSITALEAMRDLGIMRLAARISDLEARGIHFVHAQETAKNRYDQKVSYTRYKFV